MYTLGVITAVQIIQDWNDLWREAYAAWRATSQPGDRPSIRETLAGCECPWAPLTEATSKAVGANTHQIHLSQPPYRHRRTQKGRLRHNDWCPAEQQRLRKGSKMRSQQ
jgi:hypothetical protein